MPISSMLTSCEPVRPIARGWKEKQTPDRLRWMRPSPPVLLLAVTAATAFLAGCGSDGGNGGDDPLACAEDDSCPEGRTCRLDDRLCVTPACEGDVGAAVVALESTGATVQRLTGAAPVAGAGPTASVVTPATVINGGTLAATVSADAPFSCVVVAGCDGGYYQVSLPASVTTAELFLTLAPRIPAESVDLRVAVGTCGSVGSYEEAPIAITVVGTGELQVSVSWDVDSDVDLHVVDPTGAEVFYGQETVASGGALDLDSNAACNIDGVRNENIRWAEAPAGTYIVRVDYYASCSVPESRYVVTVNRRGRPAETFMGTLTGAGDGGGAGSGVEVTRFTLE